MPHIFLFAIASLFLTTGLALSQEADIRNSIAELDAFEDRVLEARQYYLDREEELAQPIWYRAGDEVFVTDATETRAMLAQLVFVLESMGADQAILNRLNPFQRAALPMIMSQPTLGEEAIHRVMHELRRNSAAIRSATLTEIDTVLTQIAARREELRDDLLQFATLEGDWQGCDGRIVRFTGSPSDFDGIYVDIGNLGQYGFAMNELGYRNFHSTETFGTYRGEVLWRDTGGTNPRWVESYITLAGNSYRDSGADACSRNMTRVGTAR